MLLSFSKPKCFWMTYLNGPVDKVAYKPFLWYNNDREGCCMMGYQSRQMAMIFVDMESLIPKNHLLRKIDRMVSFDFIYDLLAPYYPATGRPSTDPASMFKMLLIGYLYGIKSERRLVEEVRLNIAYRWFCGFELDDAIPDHSTFSKTRTRKWQQSALLSESFL